MDTFSAIRAAIHGAFSEAAREVEIQIPGIIAGVPQTYGPEPARQDEPASPEPAIRQHGFRSGSVSFSKTRLRSGVTLRNTPGYVRLRNPDVSIDEFKNLGYLLAAAVGKIEKEEGA